MAFGGNPNQPNNPFAPRQSWMSRPTQGGRNPYGFGTERIDGALAPQRNVPGMATNTAPLPARTGEEGAAPGGWRPGMPFNALTFSRRGQGLPGSFSRNFGQHYGGTGDMGGYGWTQGQGYSLNGVPITDAEYAAAYEAAYGQQAANLARNQGALVPRRPGLGDY